MSAIPAIIVICLLVAVSFCLQRISDKLFDVAKALEDCEKVLMKEYEELEKALKEGEQE